MQLKSFAPTEAELVAEAKSGNREAFGNLVQRYQDRAFNGVLQIVRCHAEAEEIVQEAFLQAYMKLPTFQGNSSFFTWLYRIAINLALSTRRRRREPRVNVRESAVTEPADSRRSAIERLMADETGREVRSAMNRLTDEHRAILVLREYEGFDYRTISRVLGIKLGSVRSRLHRARTAMRHELKSPPAR